MTVGENATVPLLLVPVAVLILLKTNQTFFAFRSVANFQFRDGERG